MSRKLQLAAPEPVEPLLRAVRGERVIFDADLARIYGVSTKRLNEQVRRNAERFPADFMFQLSRQEFDALRSQIATLNETPNRSQIATGSQKHRDPRSLPYAFTEHGAIMAANVLNSPQATHNLQSVIGNLQSSEAWRPPPQPEPKRRQIGFHVTDEEETE